MNGILISIAGGMPRPVRGVLRFVRNLVSVAERIVAGQKVVPAFWADALNFGDQITPALLRSYGVVPWLVQATNANLPSSTLLSCGSILGWVSSNYPGYVLGSGLAMLREAKQMPHARFLCVRGALTRGALGLGEDVFCGDPGLLAERLLSAKEYSKKTFLGIVPQQIDIGGAIVGGFYNELKHQAEGRGKTVKLISSRQTPQQVIAEIATCEFVVSSSLHGLIVADALGIPNARMRFDKDIGDFKFADYYSVYGESGDACEARSGMKLDEVVALCKFPDLRKAKIAAIKTKLDEAFRRYLSEVCK